MNETDWLESVDPQKMLEFLRGKVSDRKLRLFAVACCRRLWHLLTDERSRSAVEAAERYADGAISRDVFDPVFQGVNKPRSLITDLHWAEGWRVADYVSFGAALLFADASTDTEAYPTERERQSVLLRDVIGNPFRRKHLHRSKVKNRRGHVRKLAWDIYLNRDFDRLLGLAEALEDAGCSDAEILGHLRGTGPHTRGCWPLDLVLGKEGPG